MSTRLSSGRVSRLTLLLACLLLASAAAATGYFAGRSAPLARSDQQRASQTAAEPRAVEAPAAASPRPPAIVLPRQAVELGAEQLQAEAEEVADELLARYSELAEAHHVRAMLHAQLRQTEQAQAIWQRCIELSPHVEAYYVNLAAIAIDRGDSQLAVDTLQRARDAGLESPDLLHHLGVALSNVGRHVEAVEVTREGLQRHPRAAAFWLVLGQAQLKLGHAEQAAASLQQALELGSDSASVYFALGNALARQGKHEQAAAARQEFAARTEGQPLDAQQRFQILSAAEARRTAVTILCEAGSVHARQGATLEAERLFLRALSLDPLSLAACYALAGLYHPAEMHAEERAVRQRMVELDPHNFDHYVNLAKVSAQLGQPEAAEATLKLAMSVRPDAVEPYAALAQFYLHQGKAKLARWCAQEAVRREPTAEGYRFLASTCRLLGDEADAAAALDMAQRLRHTPAAP